MGLPLLYLPRGYARSRQREGGPSEHSNPQDKHRGRRDHRPDRRPDRLRHRRHHRPDRPGPPGTPLTLPVDEQTPSASFKAGRGPALSTLISAETGGTINLGRYSLTFPPGALTEDTEITIRQSTSSTMTLELGPHGLQFQKPVTLSANVGGMKLDPTASVVGVAWFNENTAVWEHISEMPAGTTEISAELWHFSDYEFFQG